MIRKRAHLRGESHGNRPWKKVRRDARPTLPLSLQEAVDSMAPGMLIIQQISEMIGKRKAAQAVKATVLMLK
jgi:hypothetical protein